MSVLTRKQRHILENNFLSLPPFLQEHSERTAVLSVRLWQLASKKDSRFPNGLRNVDAVAVSFLGKYHDIGKNGIERSIWEAEGELSPTVRKLVCLHTVFGALFLVEKLVPPEQNEGVFNLWDAIAQCCIYHHERWDGQGYIYGLKGEQIPYAARVVTLADAFDAMTADRPYHAGVPVEIALDEIKKEAGKQFDPVLAALFCEDISYLEYETFVKPRMQKNFSPNITKSQTTVAQTDTIRL